MKNEISELCYKTSDKIIEILNGLGYSSERKPSYESELRDLIAIEVRRGINDVGVLFYNNVAQIPISPEEVQSENEKTQAIFDKLFDTKTDSGCCGGSKKKCGCDNNEETNDNPTS